MSEFHLIRPWFLLALIPVFLMAWAQRRQHQEGAAWMKMIDPRLLKHLIVGEQGQSKLQPSQVLLVLGVLSVIALAGPSWRKQASPFADDQAGLVVLLKLGATMEATDVQPSRLDRGKFKMRDLLSLREGASSALIVYSGSSHLVMPLTKDDAIIASMAEGLTPQVMPSQGDRLDEAISDAEELLENAGVPGSILVIADTVDATQLPLLEQHRSKVPVQFLAIQPGQASIDRGMSEAAKVLGGEVIMMTQDGSDVQRASALAKTKIQHAAAEDGSERWLDGGYYLLPFILLGASLWSRKGWQ
ncbi:VWA domain-containing protein [Rubritalea marina]|uniref:VWA domain-containing protein n=1 Tax=Rubritalea marina TaxID=361055 RepID=UPI0003750502|nr:VWA domain-containing protein [Rubritalea marina]